MPETPEPFTTEVEGFGTMTMQGEGPWQVRANNGSSHDIIDGAGRVQSPTITYPSGLVSPNVVFARLVDATAVVDAFNAAFVASDEPAEGE